MHVFTESDKIWPSPLEPNLQRQPDILGQFLPVQIGRLLKNSKQSLHYCIYSSYSLKRRPANAAHYRTLKCRTLSSILPPCPAYPPQAALRVKLDIKVSKFPKYNGGRDEHIKGWIRQMDTDSEDAEIGYVMLLLRMYYFSGSGQL
jgi:hypothetical protein